MIDLVYASISVYRTNEEITVTSKNMNLENKL